MNAASSICMYKQCQWPGVRGDDQQILSSGCIIIHVCFRVFVQQKAPEWATFYRRRCQKFSFVWRTLLIGTEQRLGKVLRGGGAIKQAPPDLFGCRGTYCFHTFRWQHLLSHMWERTCILLFSMMCCTCVQPRCGVRPTRAGPCGIKGLIPVTQACSEKLV